jgi:hypothetical protein
MRSRSFTAMVISLCGCHVFSTRLLGVVSMKANAADDAMFPFCPCGRWLGRTAKSSRLTPLADSSRRRLCDRLPRCYLRALSPVASRSLPWPLAPTGKAFCGCRS